MTVWSPYLSHIDSFSDVEPHGISSKYSMNTFANTGTTCSALNTWRRPTWNTWNTYRRCIDWNVVNITMKMKTKTRIRLMIKLIIRFRIIHSFYAVKWFQVLLWNTTNSIRHQSFVCTHLDCFKYSKSSNISIWPIDRIWPWWTGCKGETRGKWDDCFSDLLYSFFFQR